LSSVIAAAANIECSATCRFSAENPAILEASEIIALRLQHFQKFGWPHKCPVPHPFRVLCEMGGKPRISIGKFQRNKIIHRRAVYNPAMPKV
jgi:hypothetical protein